MAHNNWGSTVLEKLTMANDSGLKLGSVCDFLSSFPLKKKSRQPFIHSFMNKVTSASNRKPKSLFAFAM